MGAKEPARPGQHHQCAAAEEEDRARELDVGSEEGQYWRLLEKATMKKVVVLSKKEEEKRKPRAA